MEQFTYITLNELDVEVNKAREDGKYCLIFDKHGSASVFFSYKAVMKDFHKDVVACSIGKKLRNQALDILRRGLVYSMRVGDTLVINIDKTMPNFTSDYNHKTEFPTERIFDFEEWRFYNNYMSVVKEDENVDLLGNKKCFVMNSNF